MRLFSPSSIYADADFLKLWTSQGFSLFGSLIGKIAMPLLVIFTLSATPTQVAWVRVCELMPGIAVGLFAGVWIDRVARLRIMIGSDILRALLVSVIPLSILFGHVSLAMIMVVAGVVSVLTVSFDSSLDAYLPTLLNPEQVVEGNSTLSATGSIAEVAGFGISGLLFQWFGGALTLSIDAITFVISFVNLLRIRKPEFRVTEDTQGETFWSEVRQGFGVLKRNKGLSLLVCVSGIQNLYYGVSATVYMLFVSRVLHVTPGVQGMLYGVGGIASFFMSNVTSGLFKRLGFGKALVLCSVVGIVGAGLLPAAFGPEWLIILVLLGQQVVGDGADTVFEIGVAGFRQTQTPNALLGRVNSIWRVVIWISMLVGTVAGGLLGQMVGLRNAMVFAVLLRVIGLLVVVFSRLRHIDQIAPQ